MKSIIREHKGFWKQIFKLSKSELIKTYKGAALGPVWAIIRPAVTIFVYWFAFSVGLRKSGPISYNGIEHPFFLFLITGMLPWFFIKEAVVGGSSCLRARKQFITKMPFPVSTIPTFYLLSELYVNILLTAVIYVVLLICGVMPSIYNIQLLFYIPMMYFLFLFLTWFTAPLSVISKDFMNIIRAIITALFWLSGIVWNAHGIENPILRRIVLSFPISYFANGYRNALLYQKWFFETPFETGCMLIWMVALLIIGSLTYNRLRKKISDVL